MARVKHPVSRSLRLWPLLGVLLGVAAGLVVAVIGEQTWRLGCLIIGVSLLVGRSLIGKWGLKPVLLAGVGLVALGQALLAAAGGGLYWTTVLPGLDVRGKSNAEICIWDAPPAPPRPPAPPPQAEPEVIPEPPAPAPAPAPTAPRSWWQRLFGEKA